MTVAAGLDDEVAAAVVARFGGSVAYRSYGQIVVYVPGDDWHGVAMLLRDEERFTQCLDVTAVDHLLNVGRPVPSGVEPQRFEVVANFLSHPRNRRMRVVCEIAATEPELDSIVDLYPGVAFAEREVFDLFGIGFRGHPELTRILMPDDWPGHPLRKDDAPASAYLFAFKNDPAPR